MTYTIPEMEIGLGHPIKLADNCLVWFDVHEFTRPALCLVGSDDYVSSM